MPRTAVPRPSLRLSALAGVIGVVALGGPAAGTSGAATRHAPCPTAGTTLARDVGPNLRVWRERSTLKACSRWPGERRHVRTLGPWSPATQVATGDGAVAWTTAARTDAGRRVDAITTIDVEHGDRWLRTSRAAVARDATTPASEDRVLRLITSDLATGWVTAGGVVGLAVEQLDEAATTQYPAGSPADLHRSGRRYFLGDAGPAGAAAARGLRFSVGGEHDECGGSDVHALEVPAFGGRDAASFTFAETPVAAAPGCAA